MNNDKDSKWSGGNQPNGRQPDLESQSGPPDEADSFAQQKDLPGRVVGALEELDQCDSSVPDSVRTVILKDAAEVLKRQQSRPARKIPHWSRKSWTGISAGVLASALLVAVMLPTGPDAPSESSMELAESMAEDSTTDFAFRSTKVSSGKDVDGNGRVNILDAFALARTIEGDQTGGPLETAQLDQNGDGVVNSDDVNSIAMSVVML